MISMQSISAKWRDLDLLMRLIVINLAVFLVIRLLGVGFLIFGGNIDAVINELALPSSPSELLVRPWTVVTYMFTHYDVFHVLFNMLTLYWFGKIFLYRCSPRQLVALYVYGGLAGGILYFAWAQLHIHGLMYSATLIGASASVMAIVIADAVMMPDFEIGLLLIGRVRLKWVAVGAIVLFALGLVGNNAGGHVAHIGGMVMGAVFGLMMGRGRDITRPFNRMLDAVANVMKKSAAPARPQKRKMKPRPKTEPDSSSSSSSDSRRIDEILDKIKTSGYSSLTADEKRQLFDISNKMK